MITSPNFICDVCLQRGGAEFRSRVRGIDRQPYNLARCNHCGMITVWPLPSEDSLTAFYSANYSGLVKKGIVETGDVVVANQAAIEDGTTKIRYFEKYAGQQGGHKLLDIGCGHGFFLYAAAKSGYEACGVDIDAAAIRLAREQLHVSIVEASLTNLSLLPSDFDVVTAWQVLEHVRLPGTCTRQVCSRLKPGGVFAGSIPNIGGWYAKVRGQKWYMLIPPEHLNYFTEGSTTEMLRTAGFDPLFVGTIPLYAAPYFCTGFRARLMTRCAQTRNPLLRSVYRLFHRTITLVKRHLVYRVLNLLIIGFRLGGNSIFFVARKR